MSLILAGIFIGFILHSFLLGSRARLIDERIKLAEEISHTADKKMEILKGATAELVNRINELTELKNTMDKSKDALINKMSELKEIVKSNR